MNTQHSDTSEPETRALAQANRLDNLATHLRAYPHLTSVIVHGGGRLQVETSANPARALLEWISTLAQPRRVQCRLIEEKVFVYATGLVAGRVEMVWDALDGFAEYLADVEVPVPTSELSELDSDLLRCFADAYDRAKRWLSALEPAAVPS